MEITAYKKARAANECARCGTQLRKVLRRDEIMIYVRRALSAAKLPDPQRIGEEDMLRFQTRRGRELFERLTYDVLPNLAAIDAAERSLCGSCYAGGAR